MVWSCYERNFGNCKNGYGNERRRKRGKGRPKKRQLDATECDMRIVDICVDGVKWRFSTQVADTK